MDFLNDGRDGGQNAACNSQVMRLICSAREIFLIQLLTLTGNETRRVYASSSPNPPPRHAYRAGVWDV